MSFPSTVISVYGGFLSTVDNFRDTFRSPQYSFIASYDAKSELKTVKSHMFVETFLDKCAVGHLGDRGKRDGEVVKRWLVHGRLWCNMTPVVFEECNISITRAVIVL